MSDIKVTQEQIDALINSAEVKVETVFGKCTTVAVKLANGFILTESSACVDPENYDAELGKKLCLQHIENRLWELEGYALQKKLHEHTEALAFGTFGWAIELMKAGYRLSRKGWNGKKQYIELATCISYVGQQNGIVNAEHNDIGSKAIAFVGTSGVQLGWLASQADMLAEDWELHSDEKKVYIDDGNNRQKHCCDHDWKYAPRVGTNGLRYTCRKCGAVRIETLGDPDVCTTCSSASTSNTEVPEATYGSAE